MIVLDTHAFLWYGLDDPQLPVPIVRRMQANPQTVLLPTICLWEAMMLAQRGRINLQGDDPQSLLTQLVKRSGFTEVPLTSEVAMLSRTLSFEHEDPADRFIAATAYAMNAELATSDRKLRTLPWLKLAY